MNAPDTFLTLHLGEAEVRVPREAAVMAYIEQLVEQRRPLPLDAALKTTARRLGALQQEGPNIGDQGLYGIYAGKARGYNGDPDAVLEVIDEAPSAMTWPEAVKWAESTGGRLPTRKEQALLFANVPELFKQEAYWSGEQFAGAERWAWFQTFSYGDQDTSSKDDQLRVRAVRRLSL